MSSSEVFPRNPTHPEQKEGEQLVANVKRGKDHSMMGFKTARLGDVAYNRDGEVLEDFRPIFVMVTNINEQNPPHVLEWLMERMQWHTGLLKQ